MAQRPIRKVTVRDKQWLTPNMRRVTLTGQSLSDFPERAEGSYVKLLLPKRAPIDLSSIDVTTVDAKDFAKRSYTVRAFDPVENALVLDFVHHGDGGPATRWATSANPGDHVLITGPGPVKMLDDPNDWVFLAGDMTALPAIGANLERLPPTTRGYAVIEVLSSSDRQELTVPSNLEVIWVENADYTISALARRVRALEWLDGDAAVWAAAEYSTMKALREYFFTERKVRKDISYVSSYWKLGSTDEEHKLAKKADQ